MSDSAPGWYADPSGQHKLRYWDGSRWSEQVSDFDQTTTDPIDPNLAAIPPAPGTRAAPTPQQVPPESGESRTHIGLILLAAVVVVIVVIAVLIAIDSNEDTSVEEETPSTTIVVVTPPTAPDTTAPTTPSTTETTESQG